MAPLPWFQGSAYDDVYIAAECLRQTGDDQDADGFRDCLYALTFSGAIGDNYSFDANGDVAGLSNAVVEVLPTGRADRGEPGQADGWAPLPPHKCLQKQRLLITGLACNSEGQPQLCHNDYAIISVLPSDLNSFRE